MVILILLFVRISGHTIGRFLHKSILQKKSFNLCQLLIPNNMNFMELTKIRRRNKKKQLS